jgi:protoheme IX farnesyltransferase
MKRSSIYNTHAGAVVGALPPVMGWTATGASILDPGCWILAAILYTWQFPHFNSLSWALREDYTRAGYKMASVVNPEFCKRLALQYAVVLFPVCVGAWSVGLTDIWFLVDGGIVNGGMVWLAWRFWREGGKKEGKRLFLGSLVHLPVLLGLLLFHKQDSRLVQKQITF